MTALAQRALDAAGIRESVDLVTPISDENAVNRSYLVQLHDGRRHVLRQYRWPYDQPDELRRPEKEAWLAELLVKHGVPAPRTLARVQYNGGTVVLREFLPGRALGDLPPASSSDAWRAAGETLARIHNIRIGSTDRAGVIIGTEVRPFQEGGWGEWHLANALAHSRRIAARGHYHVKPDRVARLFSRAVQLLDARPIRLLHNDTHAWNILVHQAEGRWRCTGWLDWEFAWMGDPAWDVARLDLFRIRDIGKTPPAFQEGYGAARVPVVSELYELAIMLWMSNQADDGDTTLLPTYRNAHEYLLHADATLMTLEDAIGC